MIKKLLFPVAISIFAIVFSVIFFIDKANSEKLSASLGLIPLAWLLIILALFKIKVPFPLEITYYIYLFLAMCLGAVLRFYDLFLWWDILLHTSFGYIGGLISLYLLSFNKVKVRLFIILVFCFAGSMAMGSVWEIMEFTMDRLVGSNTQHNIATENVQGGVFDTMEDILANGAGIIIFVIHYGVTYKKNLAGNGFFAAIEKSFLNMLTTKKDSAKIIVNNEEQEK